MRSATCPLGVSDLKRLWTSLSSCVSPDVLSKKTSTLLAILWKMTAMPLPTCFRSICVPSSARSGFSCAEIQCAASQVRPVNSSSKGVVAWRWWNNGISRPQAHFKEGYSCQSALALTQIYRNLICRYKVVQMMWIAWVCAADIRNTALSLKYLPSPHVRSRQFVRVTGVTQKSRPRSARLNLRVLTSHCSEGPTNSCSHI